MEFDEFWVVERSRDGKEFQSVVGGSVRVKEATMLQCAPGWRRQGFRVRARLLEATER